MLSDSHDSSSNDPQWPHFLCCWLVAPPSFRLPSCQDRQCEWYCKECRIYQLYISCIILSIIVRITCAIQSSMDLDGYGKSTTPSKCVGLNDSVATSICRGGAGHETCNNLQRQYGSGLSRTTCPPCGALTQSDGVSKDVLVLCWPLLWWPFHLFPILSVCDFGSIIEYVLKIVCTIRTICKCSLIPWQRSHAAHSVGGGQCKAVATQKLFFEPDFEPWTAYSHRHL